MTVTALRPQISERTGQARGLRDRAASLRTQATGIDDVLGLAYRRRAAELELEAFLLDVLAGDDATGWPAA